MKARAPSRAQRVRDRLAQLRLLHGFEKALGKKVSLIIASQGKTLAKHYALVGSIDSSVLTKHKAEFTQTLIPAYKRVITAFTLRIQGNLKKDSGYDQVMQQWLLHRSLDTVDNVDATTLDIVRTVIANGVANGDTTTAISQAITDRTSAAINAARAAVIARTEMHTAANEASLVAAKTTGIQGLQKTWTSSLDDRTREDHAEADGQTVGIDEDFDVGGEPISRPGEGSAEESVNCRCVMVMSSGKPN